MSPISSTSGTKYSSISAATRVDADDRLVASRVPVLGRVLDEVEADREHEVGVLEAGHVVVVRLQADGAERLRVGGVEQALGHERLGDRDARRADELAQRGRGAAAHDAVAGERDRVQRTADEIGGLEQLARGRLGADGLAPRQRLEVVDLGAHHVLGQLDVRRAGLLRLGDLERLADRLGDDVDVVQPRVPLRDRLHDAHEVDVLVRLLVHPLEVGLAGQRDERRTVEVRVGDGGDQVQRARPERPEAHARAPGQAPVDVGHVGAALLVAHRYELDGRAGERLVQVERLLAGNAEDVLDALSL